VRLRVFPLNRARLVATAVVMAAAAPAVASPRVVSFSCHIDGGRKRVLPPAQERDSYDELLCRVAVTGLRGRNAQDLAVELLLLPPDGSFRVVATSHLAPVERRRDRAKIDELVVPHATWAAGIDWKDRRRLRLQLRLLDRPRPGSRQWSLLATRTWELGGTPRPPLISVKTRTRSARKR
jgi:hypothetical protein